MFNLISNLIENIFTKKIVIQNLNISEDRSEKHTQDYKNSFTLGQFFLNKGEVVQNRQLQILDKEKEFLGFI